MDFKIKSSAGLAKILKILKSKGKRTVFTNGCFDIIHFGHIKILSKAKEEGDILVVGLNSDSSVRSIKGDARPINNERDRARVLASLTLVDYVVIFNEPTPENLIRKLRPDVLVKGGDWKADDIVGSDIVKSYGGKIVRVPFVKGRSTTSILRKLIKL